MPTTARPAGVSTAGQDGGFLSPRWDPRAGQGRARATQQGGGGSNLGVATIPSARAAGRQG